MRHNVKRGKSAELRKVISDLASVREEVWDESGWTDGICPPDQERLGRLFREVEDLQILQFELERDEEETRDTEEPTRMIEFWYWPLDRPDDWVKSRRNL